MSKYIYVLLLSFFFFSNEVAQNIKYYQFVFADSSKIIGEIVYEDDNVIQIKNLAGSEIRVNKKSVTSIKEVVVEIAKDSQNSTMLLGNEIDLISHHEADSIKNSFYKDKTENRLFLTPTARNLKKGSGNVGVHELFLPYVSVGIIDRISVSVSMYIFPHLVNGVFFFSSQVNLYSDNYTSVAVGGFIADALGGGWGNPYLYGVTSVGEDRGFVNLGIGVAPNSKNLFFTVGGEYRLSAGGKIITDNFFLSTGEGLGSIGVRTIGKNVSFDFGLIFGVNFYSEKFFFPFVGIAYNF
jgi:hypothetical protein